MTRSEFLFKLIDVIGRPLQNTLHFKGITHIKDLVYNNAYDRTKLDVLYRTDIGDRKKPVIVYFHGGGFMKGGKKYRTSILQMLANEGFCVIAANYRLAPEHPFPDAVEDVFTALNYLPKIKDLFHLDLDKVVVAGDSSGAYLAAYAVSESTSPALRARLNLPEMEVSIAGFVGYCGVYDVAKMISVKVPFGFTRQTGSCMLGMKLDRDLKNLKDYHYIDCISPLDFVDKNWCPSVILYSKKDLLCRGQGEAFVEKLENEHIPHVEYHSTRLLDNHCFHFQFWRKAAKGANTLALQFLRDLRELTAEELREKYSVKTAE